MCLLAPSMLFQTKVAVLIKGWFLTQDLYKNRSIKLEFVMIESINLLLIDIDCPRYKTRHLCG